MYTVDIDDEEGTLSVHFDGWFGYDYWITPVEDKIHPIGYMKHIGSKLKKYNSTLQKPKNYSELLF